MLYRKMRNKSMKRETTEGGGQGERETGYMCYDEQKRRHRTQGSIIRREYEKGTKQKREKGRSGGGKER
jgi:hypothetical protein